MCTVSKDVQSIEKNLPSCYDWLVVKKYRYLKQDKSMNCMDKLLKRSDLKMMQKIQKFGGAMFTPVLLFAFAGISVGIGTLFTTQAIMGSLAAPTSMWYKCWNVFLQGGWTVFNQLPLLFAVSLPIGMAKKQNARCCMEALVLYMTFHYFVNTILTQWGGVFGVNMNAEVGGTSGLAMIASIKTLDMGMVGALAVSGIVIYLHNRFLIQNFLNGLVHSQDQHSYS